MDFNNYLMKFDDILIFTAYMREVNLFTFKIDQKLINDYLLMYGKIKPCINGKNIYTYNTNKDTSRKNLVEISSISKLIRKYKFIEFSDYIVENGEYILSPRSYYIIIYNSKNIDLVEQFNKVLYYEHMYNIYLKMKNQ